MPSTRRRLRRNRSIIVRGRKSLRLVGQTQAYTRAWVLVGYEQAS
jgi:hypothetical protein